jgi:hypothetical protein
MISSWRRRYQRAVADWKRVPFRWMLENVAAGEHYGEAYGDYSEFSVPFLLNNEAPANVYVFAAFAKAVFF